MCCLQRHLLMSDHLAWVSWGHTPHTTSSDFITFLREWALPRHAIAEEGWVARFSSVLYTTGCHKPSSPATRRFQREFWQRTAMLLIKYLSPRRSTCIGSQGIKMNQQRGSHWGTANISGLDKLPVMVSIIKEACIWWRQGLSIDEATE